MGRVMIKADDNMVDPLDGDQVMVGESRSRSLGGDEVDIFNKSADEIRGYSGLSAAAKKRGQRMSKRNQSVDGSAKSKANEVPQFTGYQLLDVVVPPFNMEYLTKLYTSSFPHYAAVQAKLSNVIGLGYDLTDSQNTRNKLDAEEDAEKIQAFRRKLQRVKFSLFDRLDDATEEQDFLETLSLAYTDYEVTGNGYIEIGRNATGDIKYIGHIPASTMRVRRARDGYVQVVENKVVYFKKYGSTYIPPNVTDDPNPNEVMHLRKYNPVSSYYGVPDIIPAMQAVAGIEFASRFNLDYFENKAVPRYVIVVKGSTLSGKSQADIINFFEGNLRGQNHRTLYVPLPADSQDKKYTFEMKPVEAGTQDASFVNYHKINVQSILMAHRVPISKIGMAEGVSLAVARDADKTFKEQVCRPTQRVIEKKISKIIKEWTNAFTFKLNELTLTDELEQAKIDQIYLNAKTIVPNEVRGRWGYPGLPNGDKPIELKPQQAAESRAQAGQTRTRDQQRAANSTDDVGGSRNPKGEGRQQA